MGEDKGLRHRGKECCANQRKTVTIKGKWRKKRQWWKECPTEVKMLFYLTYVTLKWKENYF